MRDPAIDEILRRLTAVELAVKQERLREIEQLDRRLNTRQVSEREDVDERTIKRWVKQGIYPLPDVVNGRNYWWLSVLLRHDRERIRQATRFRGERKQRNADASS